MALTKAFDFIRTSADKAFLAHCSCNGAVCQCHVDGQILATSQFKDTEMNLDKMTAAQRAELASKIESAAEHMTADERRTLIDTLSAALADDSKTKEKAETKTRILANILATKTDTIGSGKREYDYLSNDLRNHSVTVPLDELVWKTHAEIDQIFSAAKLDPVRRGAAKRFMGRLVTGKV
jgi:hypothetical protein